MIRKLLLYLFFYIAPFLNAGAQKVVNITGSALTTDVLVVEYSVGEICIATVDNNTNAFTQGLLQPFFKIVTPVCTGVKDRLVPYPNPSKNRVNLWGAYDWITGYQLYAADGKLLQVVNNFKDHIQLAGLPNGVYIARLLPGCNGVYKVLKLTRQ